MKRLCESVKFLTLNFGNLNTHLSLCDFPDLVFLNICRAHMSRGQPRVRWNIERAAALNYFKIFPQPIGGGGARARRSSPDLVKNK